MLAPSYTVSGETFGLLIDRFIRFHRRRHSDF